MPPKKPVNRTPEVSKRKTVTKGLQNASIKNNVKNLKVSTRVQASKDGKKGILNTTQVQDKENGTLENNCKLINNNTSNQRMSSVIGSRLL